VRPVPFAVVHAISFYVWSRLGSGDWRHKSRPRGRHQWERDTLPGLDSTSYSGLSNHLRLEDIATS